MWSGECRGNTSHSLNVAAVVTPWTALLLTLLCLALALWSDGGSFVELLALCSYLKLCREIKSKIKIKSKSYLSSM